MHNAWKQIPTWFKIVAAIFMLFSVFATVRTFQECGTKTFLLGNGAFYAAVTGMCKQK